jgi:peptidoglycan/xylan/chitin deacetylase (PgdA/CDA1 family)
MFIEQPSLWLRWIYPDALWRMDRHERAVYLTFDDGPIPEVTPRVLDILDHYGVKATFFMVGDNVRKHPREFEMVKARGHRIGNHTFNHIGGLLHGIRGYLNNVDKADGYLHTDLVRPPYGWLKWEQYLFLRRRYQLVMWDLVTRDYSKRLNGKQVLWNVRHYARNGSIITFHDSLKSADKLWFALPRSIEWLQSQGYAFKTFPKMK